MTTLPEPNSSESDRKVKVRAALAQVGLVLVLAGCADLPTFSDLNRLPGFSRSLVKIETHYDPTILGYRTKGEDVSGSPALRSVTGKKIQTEQELDRLIAASEEAVIGSGTKYTAYGLVGLYAPINLVDTLVAVLPNVPLYFASSTLNEAHQTALEAAYLSGREHFDRGEFREALADWDSAKAAASNLHFYSDVDYWRGRALEASGKSSEAFIAYRTFLSYSESTRPPYFKQQVTSDMTWAEVASDIKKRLHGVPAAP